MTGPPQRRHKKHPAPDAVEEPLLKRLSLGTPEIIDTAIEPRARQQTQAPPASTPLRLTKKNLRRLDKMNGSTQAGVASASAIYKSTQSDKTKATTTSGFQKQAIANGVLPHWRSKPPHNAQEIIERLNKRRGSASPTESQYRQYCRKIHRPGHEVAVVHRMLPLFKDYEDNYNVDMNRSFSALPKNIGFNNGLSAPQPDFVEGLSREEFLPVDPNVIKGAVLFKDEYESTTLPHLAGEWKSKSGDMNQAKIQSGYDGAAMVYGRTRAREYLDEPDPLGHSAVTSFTSNGEHVSFFAHHATPTDEDGKVEYHQHYLTRTDLTDSYESFKKGRTQIRNAQDYAREQSFALRDQLRTRQRTKRSPAATISEC